MELNLEDASWELLWGISKPCSTLVLEGPISIHLETRVKGNHGLKTNCFNGLMIIRALGWSKNKVISEK